MRVLAVGDIHQKKWIVDKVINVIDGYDKVVFVGDYLDNWDADPFDRVSMVGYLANIKNRYGDKVVFIAGNHDICYVDKRYSGKYGGHNARAQILFNIHVDEKKWIESLPHTHNIDGVTYSHAGITVGWNNSTEPIGEDGHMWVRPDDGYVYQPRQVFGHTPQKTCVEVQKDVWCIDTFSQYKDLTYIGDHTVLEVIDGREFNVVKVK